jgi:hypothetical protein
MINKNSIQDLATRYIDGIGIDVLSKLSGWSITDLKTKINDYITSRRQKTDLEAPQRRTRKSKAQLQSLPQHGQQRTHRKLAK